ncbi:hypothetical protein [Pelomonas sp. SE-A7]|uniref:DUF6968 family protein n=1 Tax=Pelomonas sp. SE-A7 TaxID=3054953 RepID=UPI00259C801E|nr:hypothetical protein [Pelomonas sp. SE-A7]MDM4768549.1 hypothetical protein [Pelomonas sp. SE-A7]
MAKQPVIAESKFFADPGSGERHAVHVRIRLPQARRREASCKVEIRGVTPELEIFGEDTMQALALAVRFVNNTLALRHKQGWRFYLEESDRRSFAVWRVWGHSPRLSAFQIPAKVNAA